MASCSCSNAIHSSVVPSPATAATTSSTTSEDKLFVSSSAKAYAVLSRIDCPHVVFLRPCMNGWTYGSMVLLTTRNKDVNNSIGESIECKVEFISAHRSQAVRVKLLMELLELEKRSTLESRVLNETVYEEDLLHIECPQTLSIVQDLSKKIDHVLIGVGKMYCERESQTESKQYVHCGCQVNSQQSVGCDGRVILGYKACQTDSLIMATVNTQTNIGQNCGVQVDYDEVMNAGTQTGQGSICKDYSLPYTPSDQKSMHNRNLSFATPTNRNFSSFPSVSVNAENARFISPEISGSSNHSVSCRRTLTNGISEDLQSSLSNSLVNDAEDLSYEPLSERELSELLVISKGHDARFFREMFLKICANTLHLNLNEQDPKIEIYMRRKLQKYFCGGDSYKQWIRVNSSLQTFRANQGYTSRRIKNEKAEEAARLRKRFISSNPEESAGTGVDTEHMHHSSETPSPPVCSETPSKRRNIEDDRPKDSGGNDSEINIQNGSKENLTGKSTTTSNLLIETVQSGQELTKTQNSSSENVQCTPKYSSIRKDRPADYKTTTRCNSTMNCELAKDAQALKQCQNETVKRVSPRISQPIENNGNLMCNSNQTATSEREIIYCNTSSVDVHIQSKDASNAINYCVPTASLCKECGLMNKEKEIDLTPILIDSDSDLSSVDYDIIYERTVVRHKGSESLESSGIQLTDVKNSCTNDIVKKEILD